MNEKKLILNQKPTFSNFVMCLNKKIEKKCAETFFYFLKNKIFEMSSN